MNIRTTDLAVRTIATGLIELLERAEDVSRAYDALALPESDDEPVDWAAVLASVDRLGAATFQLAATAKEKLLPTLKTLKRHAQAQRDEIARLEQLVAPTPTTASSSA